MKMFTKFSILVTTLLLSVHAFGGAGLGGSGFGKTKLLLQSFAQQTAILTLEDVTNIPETEIPPRIKAPEDEYPNLLAEACAAPENDPFVLPVESTDGSVRNFAINCVGGEEGEPRFLLVTEVEAENEKIVE